jgi:ABC-type oligopeptide transport system substrate-binding subunit
MLARGRVLSIILSGVALATACSPSTPARTPDPRYAADQVLRLAASEEVRTLDPALIEDRAVVALAQNVFNGLTRFHEKTLLPEPDIAESWKVSENGSVYTFTLRQDVSFSNGDPVTAKDFKYSWERALDPQRHAPYAFLFDAIKGALEIEHDLTGKVRDLAGVKALDDHTLQVTLVQPGNYFLTQTALWVFSVVDVKVAGANPKWAEPPGQVVGTGPFSVAEWTKEKLTLRAVPGWWGSPKPRLRQVIVDVIKDSAMQVQRYEAQALDAVQSLSLGDLTRIRRDAREARELQVVTTGRTSWVGFNFTRPPFSTSKKLRRAMCESIDKELLAKQVLGEKMLGVPASAFIPPAVPGHLGALPDPFPLNRNARSLLAEADPDGSLTRDLTFWTSDTPLNRRLAENLAVQWNRNLGIVVKLGFAPTAEFVRKRRNHEYTLFRGSWGADYPHPQGWLQPVAQTQQEWNAEGYSNPDLDRALQEAIRTQKPEDAARRYQAVEKMYLQDLAACELFWSTEQYLIKPTVRGYGGNALLPFKWYNVAIFRGN